MSWRRGSELFGAIVVSASLAVAGCGGEEGDPDVGGDVDAGRQLIESLGCGGCHTIGGIATAGADIGPDLRGLADEELIAGKRPNNTRNLVAWLRNPQAISPGTVMPALVGSERSALDIAAYLYSDENE